MRNPNGLYTITSGRMSSYGILNESMRNLDPTMNKPIPTMHNQTNLRIQTCRILSNHYLYNYTEFSTEELHTQAAFSYLITKVVMR